MGAADVLWDRAGQRLGGTAIMEELHQQAVKAAQDALGEDRYAALFRDGADRPLDLVVKLATGLSPMAPSPDRPPPPPGPPGP
jgi:non-specific serine/threonine protein kinase